MVKLPDIAIKSITGQKYKFATYSIDHPCREMPGVYLVTHRAQQEDGEGLHHYLSVGETDNLSQWREQQSPIQCWTAYEANCIAVLFEPDYQIRLRIVDEIRESYELPCD